MGERPFGNLGSDLLTMGVPALVLLPLSLCLSLALSRSLSLSLFPRARNLLSLTSLSLASLDLALCPTPPATISPHLHFYPFDAPVARKLCFVSKYCFVSICCHCIEFDFPRLQARSGGCGPTFPRSGGSMGRLSLTSLPGEGSYLRLVDFCISQV